MAATRFPIPDHWLNRSLLFTMIGSVSIFMVSLLSWQFPSNKQAQLKVGQVAPTDISSPARITYASDVLTEQARERAAQVVPEQYDSAEGRVRRQQFNRSREILSFITAIRNDPHASPELQVDYLLAISELALEPEAAYRIQALSTEDWQIVVTETPLTLDRVMRDEIRENNLTTTRRRVPSLIDSNVNETASEVVANLMKSAQKRRATKRVTRWLCNNRPWNGVRRSSAPVMLPMLNRWKPYNRLVCCSRPGIGGWCCALWSSAPCCLPL